jgi:hypothetical protein
MGPALMISNPKANRYICVLRDIGKTRTIRSEWVMDTPAKINYLSTI